MGKAAMNDHPKALAERARIVAWLREQAMSARRAYGDKSITAAAVEIVADGIDLAEHLKGDAK